VFHFTSLFFKWIKVAVVGGSLYGPCDCMYMHCDQSCRYFLLTVQFTVPVEQMFHQGGITGNVSVPQYMRVYPKYSGLVLPSIQQLCWREAPVDGRTTMSSESVCQVAHSRVDVGNFHTCLVVRCMIFAVSI
jgi:hypothetical protein